MERRIRVMLVIPQLYTGGVQKLAIELANQMRRSNIDMRVLSLKPRSGSIFEAQADAYGLDVQYLNKKGGVDLSIIPQIYRAIQDFKPDVIHANQRTMTYLLLPSLFSRCVRRRYYAVHSLADMDAKGIDRFILKLANRAFGMRFVAISDYCRESISRVYHVPLNKIDCVYNGVDLARFGRKKPYETMNEEPLIFLSVGSFLPLKNKGMMIDAFERTHREYPQTRLILLGDGPERVAMEDKVRTLGLETCVDFLGDVSDVETYLAMAHIYIMSSNYEGLPVTILEAIASGLPIISTRVGGIVDVIEDGVNGLLSEPMDTDGLTASMKRLVADRALRLSLAAGSSLAAHNYSIEHMAQGYKEIYSMTPYENKQ